VSLSHRTVVLVSSTPFLIEYINKHPLKHDPEAPLWITSQGKTLKYSAVRNMLGRLFAKAGIKKKANPHNFRHSRATHLANHLTEFQMNQYLGWVQGSDMPAIYIHESGLRMEEAIKRMNGIEIKDKDNASKLKPQKCKRCSHVNNFCNEYCSKCGYALSLKTALQYQDELKKEKIIKVEILQKMFAEFIKQNRVGDKLKIDDMEFIRLTS